MRFAKELHICICTFFRIVVAVKYSNNMKTFHNHDAFNLENVDSICFKIKTCSSKS